MDNLYLDACLESAYEKIVEVCEDTLMNQVANKLIKMQKANIKEYVYNVYPEPEQYIRRRNKEGGLLWGATSKTNITQSAYESEVSIYNRAKGFKKDLPMLIEYGHKASGYTYNFPRKGRAYMKPRQFMQATFNDMVARNIVEKILQKELKRAFGSVRLV